MYEYAVVVYMGDFCAMLILFTQKKGIADDELVAILDCIATSKGMDNLKDILELLIALMFEGKSITSLLIENDGIK